MKNKVIAIVFLAAIIGGIYWYNIDRYDMFSYMVSAKKGNDQVPSPIAESKWKTLAKIESIQDIIQVSVKEKYGSEKTFYGTYLMESSTEYLIGRHSESTIKVEKSNTFSISYKVVKVSSL
jgi:hypothetical protein